MEHQMYKCGIIGCGFIGVDAEDCHARAYEECTDTKLVALCDKEEWKADRYLSEDTDLELVTHSYWDMLQLCKPDIVSVCTPPETHCQIVCDIAPYVKAIWCEKPIALTLEDAHKMGDVCYKHNVILQVNHQRRFTFPVFRFSRGIMNTGTHMFDLLRQLFGELVYIEGNWVRFQHQLVRIEEVDTEEPIFELDCTHNNERMLPSGLAHLVKCIKNNQQSASNGLEARKTLEVVLKYQVLYAKK